MGKITNSLLGIDELKVALVRHVLIKNGASTKTVDERIRRCTYSVDLTNMKLQDGNMYLLTVVSVHEEDPTSTPLPEKSDG